MLTHPQVPGPVRAVPARRAGARDGRCRPSSTAEAVRTVVARGRARAGGARNAAGGGASTAGTVLREGVAGPRRQRNAVRLARAGRATRQARCRRCATGSRRGLEDVDRLLGPGAERPGWLVRCLDEFARARHQPDEDRVAPAARAARAATCSSPTSRAREHEPPVAAGARGPARALRGGARARLLPPRRWRGCGARRAVRLRPPAGSLAGCACAPATLRR